MRRTYRLPARVDEIDRVGTSILSDMGAGSGDALVRAAIGEALLNAVVYGALRVPSRDPADTGDVLRFVDAIGAAEAREANDDVTVTVEHAADGDEWSVVVRDPGPGFDVQSVASRGHDDLATSGRGLQIMRAATESLSWNQVGNEVTLRFRSSRRQREQTTPPIATTTGGPRDS
jgi:hypothetical protein